MRDGPDINAYVAAGSVLPGEELVPLLAAHLSGLPIPDSGKKIVLLDGFPRNLEQDDMARNALASGRAKEFPDLVVYFQCPKDVLKGRYVRRRRGTDDGDLFEKRWEQHVREGKSVIERYRERGLLAEVSSGVSSTRRQNKLTWHMQVDSSGKVEETSQQFVAVLESFLGQLGQRRD
jgi:UMP-CMP kinase